MVYSIPDSKLAEGSWNTVNFTCGRARALIDAMAYFENQRIRGRGRTINIGRAGIVPLNQTRAFSRSTSENSRQDEDSFPCGRVGALSTIEHKPGGLSARRGRGRGLSPPTPTTPPQPAWRGRGRGLSPPSPPTPPPLEDHSPPVRCHEACLRQPWTMPLCL